MLNNLATFSERSKKKCTRNDVQILNKKLTTLFSLLENFVDSTFSGVLENSATSNRNDMVFSGLDNYYKISATPSIKKTTGLNILTEMEFLFALGLSPITLLNILFKHKRFLQAINSTKFIEKCEDTEMKQFDKNLMMIIKKGIMTIDHNNINFFRSNFLDIVEYLEISIEEFVSKVSDTMQPSIALYSDRIQSNGISNSQIENTTSTRVYLSTAIYNMQYVFKKILICKGELLENLDYAANTVNDIVEDILSTH